MNRCLVVTSGFLLAVVAVGQDHSDLSGLPNIFRRSISAHRTSSYYGERTVVFKRGGDRVSHVEYVLKNGRKTRIEFPDESAYKGQIIVDNGVQRMHYFPDRNEIEVEPARDHSGSRFRVRPGDVDPPKFNATVTDGGTIAGFATQLVTINDASGNPMQQNWIEPHSAVVLRRILFDKVGARTGSFEFTKIRFNPSFAPGDFVIDRRGAAIITPTMQVKRSAHKLGLSAVSLASTSGYQLENSRVIHPDKNDVLVQTYVKDDARFSLFQMRGDINPDRLQNLARGRLSTYSWRRGTESFALIGNLNQDELRKIARTLGDG